MGLISSFVFLASKHLLIARNLPQSPSHRTEGGDGVRFSHPSISIYLDDDDDDEGSWVCGHSHVFISFPLLAPGRWARSACIVVTLRWVLAPSPLDSQWVTPEPADDPRYQRTA